MLVGILGGGQLGRMLALSGYPLGIQSRCLEPARESPAAQVCPRIESEYDDYGKLFAFAQGCEVITYEFENVPVQTAQWLQERLPVYPPPRALEVAQDRIREKTFFRDLGIPVPGFRAINTFDELQSGLQSFGYPAVLKTTRFGYDGKGQAVLRNLEEAQQAWSWLQGRELILEQFVSFDRELSILAVRNRSGECRFYPLMQNHHREGMLRLTLAPAPHRTDKLQQRAEELARTALEALDYVGLLAIELFEKDGQLLVNEMAPRVHNSGHWTIEGAETSQFENHLRAILGYSLGSTEPRGHCAMINLIGAMPESATIMQRDYVHLHHYGKTAKANRKLGHLTICRKSEGELKQDLEWATHLDGTNIQGLID